MIASVHYRRLTADLQYLFSHAVSLKQLVKGSTHLVLLTEYISLSMPACRKVFFSKDGMLRHAACSVSSRDQPKPAEPLLVGSKTPCNGGAVRLALSYFKPMALPP